MKTKRLPEGWRGRPLGEALPLAYGKALAARERRVDGSVIVYGSAGPTGRHDRALLDGPAVIVGRKGSAGAVHFATGPCWPIDTAYYVQPSNDVDLRYAFHLLSWLRLDRLDQSTAIPSLSRDTYNQVVAAFPDLETQRRIVARIDELFSELDDGEEELARARGDLETYRKALLKDAVGGRLTVDWRADRSIEDSGAAFLSRLSARHSSRPARTRDIQPLPFELPEGWALATLGDLVSRIEAGLNVKALGRPPETHETGIVKISAVTWDEFDETASKTLFPGTAVREANVIRSGDLLLSRANTLELVGAPAIVGRVRRRLVLSDKVLRLNVEHDLVKRWIYYVLKSPFGRQQIEATATGNQLSMRNISQDSLRALAIPLPPEAELHELLAVVDAGWLGHVEMRDALDEVDSSALRQSILAAAFRGELA